MSAHEPEPDSKQFIKTAKELQDLRDNIEHCYVQIVEKKMHRHDKTGFEYQGRHYYFIRDI